MAGIYLHIPFCKQKCHYCDFHFSTNTDRLNEMLDALSVELSERKHFFRNQQIDTIYFGGGTPSLLGEQEFERIFQTIKRHYDVNKNAEITVEANPDDLNKDKLLSLKRVGVNRLSIGIQSFDDKVLEWMNRAHNTKQTHNALEEARKIGFDNITVDLIYGIPGTGITYWKKQLDQFVDFELPHLSAYCLTIEPRTAFGKWYDQGKIIPLEEEKSYDQFIYMIDFLNGYGFEQYEISNFAKTAFRSGHNSAYWFNEPYLGIGPSAHSYDGEKREWNISNNNLYIKAIKKGEAPREGEKLSVRDHFNEHVMTRLRTNSGIGLEELRKISAKYVEEIEPHLEDHIAKGNLVYENNHYILTKKARFVADRIASELFV